MVYHWTVVRISKVIFIRYNTRHMVVTDHNHYFIKIQMSAQASKSLGELTILLESLISGSFTIQYYLPSPCLLRSSCYLLLYLFNYLTHKKIGCKICPLIHFWRKHIKYHEIVLNFWNICDHLRICLEVQLGMHSCS